MSALEFWLFSSALSLAAMAFLFYLRESAYLGEILVAVIVALIPIINLFGVLLFALILIPTLPEVQRWTYKLETVVWRKRAKRPVRRNDSAGRPAAARPPATNQAEDPST